MLPNVEYRFNVVNFVKKFALYATGRQPMIRCLEQHPNPVVPKHLLPPQRLAPPPPPLPPGWHRVGSEVRGAAGCGAARSLGCTNHVCLFTF